MKKFYVVLCSLFVIAMFAGTALVADSKVMQLPAKKPATAPKVPGHKADDSKAVEDKAAAGESEEQKNESKDSNAGKKVEKKEEQADEKK